MKKKCVKCGNTKELSEFHLQRKAKDGLDNRCKDCKREYMRTRERREAQWKYNASEQGKAVRRKYRKSSRGRKARRASAAKRKKDKKKTKIRSIVMNAIIAGRLSHASTYPCQDCGKQATEHHHEDYTKPLGVIPLCKRCHAKRHRWRVHKLNSEI